ncbi:MAG: dTDP-4-dehydrorhamnose reductase [Actinobacteria bacterium]|nr:dTDP-4-dehydrorhamnose reductase [Actinomycetota bacterium]
MRILVTGADGMLGRDLVPHLSRRHDVVGVDMDVDITDASAVSDCVGEVRPQAVIHCAAWTDVDGAEANEATAALVNADGSANVARAAAAARSALVLLSTDYVFDGTRDEPYDEDAPTAPLGAYGRTKHAGELRALAEHPAGTRIARTAWLYGRHGRNFVDTMLGLAAEREEVRVVHDQVGSPTWTCDLAPALEALVTCPPGTYHVSGGGSTSWAGFASAIFDEAGVACRVVPVTTAEFGRPAPRPPHSVLGVTRDGAPRLRPWRDALRDYIQEVHTP